MRTFVALEVSDRKVLDLLVEVQRELAATGSDIRIVGRESLHFTLKFLGEVSETQVAEADSRLKRAPPRRVEVELKGVGAFPDPSRPAVVWAGVAPSDEGLVSPIAEFVARNLEGIGETDDRPFKAHITLARVRSRRDVAGLAAVIRNNVGKSFGRVALSTLKLKESKLTPQGPVYTDIGVYPLA